MHELPSQQISQMAVNSRPALYHYFPSVSLTHIPHTGRMKHTSKWCLWLHGFQWSSLTLHIPVTYKHTTLQHQIRCDKVHQQIHKIHIWTRLWENISQTLLLAAYVLVFCFLNCMSCFARILHPSWLPSFANFLISSSWNTDNAVTYTAHETWMKLLNSTNSPICNLLVIEAQG